MKEEESNKEFNNINLKHQRVGLEDFEILKVVGQGEFGKVYLASDIYAMKVIQKDKMIEKNHVKYVISERDILSKVCHPFIVRLRYSFQVINNRFTI